jgi:hypothetical protein
MRSYTLNENERNAIETVIGYKAEQLRQPRRAIEESLCQFFWVQSLGELMKWDFDGVIRHLLGLSGGSDAK